MTVGTTTILDWEPKTTPTRAPRRRRGLLDALLVIGLGYAVYAATPIGALAEIGVRMAFGQRYRPPLFATFKGRALGAPELEATAGGAAARSTSGAGLAAGPTVSVARPAHAPLLDSLAKETGLDARLLAAFVETHGSCAGEACTVERPTAVSVGGAGPAPTTSNLMVAELARALNAERRRDGFTPELAVEALYLGRDAVTQAVTKARLSGVPRPEEVESHGQFYDPAQQRGALQGAIAVLARYRLLTLEWPVAKSYRITSPFGPRVHPIRGTLNNHSGTDVALPMRTALFAAQAGSVRRASEDSVSGRYVILDHGFGIRSSYCHLDESLVATGDDVVQQEVVGLSGTSGLSTGPHLHYAVRVNGEAVDPQRFGYR